MTTWTDEDYRLAEHIRADVLTHAVLAIERWMPEEDRQKILDKIRHSNLNGAGVADVLDIFDNGDALLNLREPFYDDGLHEQVRAALGWPTQEADQEAYMASDHLDRDAYTASLWRSRLIGLSVLAVALLTDAVPTVEAVTDLVYAASTADRES